MHWLAWLILGAIAASFLAVLVRWAIIKLKGRSILREGCQCGGGKNLVRCYHAKKRAEERDREAARRKRDRANS